MNPAVKPVAANDAACFPKCADDHLSSAMFIDINYERLNGRWNTRVVIITFTVARDDTTKGAAGETEIHF